MNERSRSPMLGIAEDVLYVLRVLARKPVFAVTATLTLAIAIGVNVAIFTVVNALWLRRPPVAEPDRLAVIYCDVARADRPSNLSEQFQWQQMERLRDVTGFTGVAAEIMAGDITGEFKPRVSLEGSALEAGAVSHEYFTVLGVQVRGRTFAAEEDRPGATPTVILADALWRSRFGADTGVIGREIRFGNRKALVIGIAAPPFRGALIGAHVDIWLPLGALPYFAPMGEPEALVIAPVRLYGRLRPGVPLAQAQTQVTTVTGRPAVLVTLAEAAYPLRSQSGVGQDRQLIMLLSATVALVLLIGCLNLAALLLARAEERRHEVTVRLAIGISTMRLIRLLLAEAMALAAAGCLAALPLSYWFLRTLSQFTLPSGVAIENLNLALDWRVGLFAIGAALVASLASGLGPAWQASRASLSALLISSTGSGARTLRTRSALLAGHVALSIVLLVMASLFVRSVHRALTMDVGFAGDRLLSVLVQPPMAQYATTHGGLDLNRRRADFVRLVGRLRALPGVAGVAQGSSPLMAPREAFPIRQFLVDGSVHEVGAQVAEVGAGYFGVAGIPLRTGRDFDETDALPNAAPVIIVTDSLATQLWPGRSALGRRLSLGRWKNAEVIGIAGDAIRLGVRSGTQQAVYTPTALPADLRRLMLDVVVRTTVPPQEVASGIRAVLRDLFPLASQADVRTPREEIATQMISERLGASVFTWFAAAALALCLLGTYGLVSYITRQRARQFAIRLALGATPAKLLQSVICQAMGPVLSGCAVGLVIAAAGTTVVRSYLFGVGSLDPLSFAGGPLLVVLAAGAAGFAGARRLLTLEPTAALRQP